MSERELRRREPSDGNGAERSAEVEIDLVELLYRLLERGWRILAAAAAGALLMALYSWVLAEPTYEATCRVYVTNTGNSAINLSDLQVGSYLAADYREVFDTWEVHEAVLEKLDLDYSYERLRKMLRVSNPSDTRILDVTVSCGDAERAAAMANAYAEVARAYISRTMDTNEPSILSAALPPEAPVRPRKLRNLALGFCLGALAMAAAVTARFLLDDRLRTAEDIRRYAGLATLAVVPLSAAAPERRSGA